MVEKNQNSSKKDCHEDKKFSDLRELVKDFPKNPGIYMMKNSVEKIIYVGKAKNLRNRVKSYFLLKEGVSPKTKLLMGVVRKLEYIITKTEVEAFLLEASLIKKHKPKYNIRLKDDRSYPYIYVSQTDAFPRLYLRRKVSKDGGQYFGPFTSGDVVHETNRMLNLIFQLRDCTDHFMRSRKRPCMTHQIGRCTAPCVGLISSETYKERVFAAVQFLRGRDKKFLKDLESRMYECAQEERFEEAARLRDGIQGLRSALEKQSVVNDQREIDIDVIAFHGDVRGTLIETLHIRAGRVVGSRPHFVGHLNCLDSGEDPRDWLATFLNQYYESNFVPNEITLPMSLGDDISKLLACVLEERSGHKVKIRFGSNHESQKLLDIAEQNAKEHFKLMVEKSDKKLKGLEEIKSKLSLSHLPMRIECYDISHFQGNETVASQVVFEEGVPVKDSYRLYKLRTPHGGDDYAAMKEVLDRRFKHPEYEDPDLVLIDGGKGQLSAAVRILQEIGQAHLPVISIAKARTLSGFEDTEVNSTLERFFIPGRANPVHFSNHSESFRILVSLRDEAHRFAINYHRKLRENSSLQSVLDAITGVGDVIKRRILDHFKDIETMRSANIEELCEVEGVGRQLAETIQIHLQKN